MALNTQLGKGRMGSRIAANDWSTTSLGPIDRWTPALRTTIEMMLGQRQAICIFWGPDLTLLYNDAYAPILGARDADALGKPAYEVWHDVWENILPFVETAFAGEGTWSEELPLVMTRNGDPEQTYWTFSYSPLYENGQISGMINVALDATLAVENRQRSEALKTELVHRAKNMLTVASAIISSSLRDVAEAQEARTNLLARMNALGKAQDLLQSESGSILLEDVIHAACEAHLDKPDRLGLSGPKVLLSQQQAVGMSLALYELATNAVKYGCLTTESGKVDISWSIDADTQFRFTWQESGGPPVSEPSSKGFGSRLTSRIVAAYFYGSGETTYEPSGIRYTLCGKLVRDEGRPQPAP